jgi:hypothetical protein
VPRTLAIQESIQVRLVEGGAELGSFGDDDGVLRATLAVPVLGALGAVVFFPVARWAVFAATFRTVFPLRGVLGVVVLVASARPLSFLHVGVLVDDRHHVAHGLGVGLEHHPPQFDIVEAFVEVVDDVPIINFRNAITASKIPLDVVAEGLIRLLHNTGQIPSGLGTRARCLVVLDEGAVEILPTVDGASGKCFEPVVSLGAHHDREVGGDDVVVAAGSSDGDGVGAQPHLGIRLTVVLLNPGRLEGGGPLDGPEPTREGGEAVEVVAGVVVVARTSWPVVTPSTAVLVVDVGVAVFLIVLASALLLGGVALAVTVVDALMQILLVELEAEIALVDLSVVAMVSCRVMT